MAQKTIAGKTVDVNEEGYMTDPSQWTREIAAELAKEEDIAKLTEAHWKIIEFLRKDSDEKGSVPSFRRLNKVGGIETKVMYDLFPGGPLKKASRIAGLTKPSSCV